MKTLATRFFALLLLLSAPAAYTAELNLDFELVNATGYDIKEIYIAPTSQEEWSAEDKVQLPGVLKNEGSVDLTFHPKNTAAKWDLKIIWAEEGDPVEWRDLNLSEISKITLYYNEKTDATTAETE